VRSRWVARRHTKRMQIFPVVTSIPPESPPFPSRDDHPVPRNGIVKRSALSTNKFYANLFLGSRTQAVWLHPFSIWWSDETPGNPKGWGLGISHVTAEQRASPFPTCLDTKLMFSRYLVLTLTPTLCNIFSIPPVYSRFAYPLWNSVPTQAK